ncbi:cilia- and flagella-associated protein 57-like isoform X2 [Stegodyphus dumicola]|uniref:cilia- and flagella-associated protein 57-like isoform X2 n=1 Tax=Stegodyphus dumicola TaxID=202533 RepID=UPI0015A9D464|nr:cilia- and flagella-associated protein 57-like isoform X2 [Stegodyphus dumicola]
MSDLLGDLGYEAYFHVILGRQHTSVVKCTDSAICRSIQATCSSEVVILRDFLKQSVLFWEKMENKICSIAIHPLGLNLLIGYDKGVKFYNILLNKLVEVKHFDQYSYPQVSLSKAGHMMVLTSGSDIHVYNLNFERYAELKGHKSVVNQVVWRDDNHLISSDQEGTIHEWDIIKKKEIWVYKIPEQTCSAFAVSTDNTYVASSGGKVRRFSNTVLNGELDAHVQMTALVIADIMLLGGTMKGSITAFPLTLEGGAIFEIPCHQSNVINLRLKDGGCTLLATGEDGMISTWRVQNVNSTETDLFAEEVLIERKVLEEEDDLILEMEKKLDNQMTKYENDRRLQNEQHEKEMACAIQGYKAIQKRQMSKIMELTEKNYNIQSSSEEELVKRIEKIRGQKNKDKQEIEAKILNESERREKLVAEREKVRKLYDSEISKIRDENESSISTMRELNEKDEAKIKELETSMQKELDARAKIVAQNKDFYQNFEELTAKKSEEFNSRLRSDLEKRLYENSLITSEIERLRGELKYEKECCRALDAEFGTKKKMHENLESTIKYIKDKISQLHDDICRKESVLDDKGSMTVVLEEEAKEMVHLNSEADWKHEDYRKVLEIKIKELSDIDKELKKLMKTQLVMERYKAEFVSCTENIQDSKALRWAMLRLLQMRILKGPIKEEEVFVGDTDPYSKFCRLRDHYESLISTILNRTKEVQTTFRKNYVKLAKENSDWTAFGEALRTDFQQKEERISCLEEALQMPWNQFATDPSETQRRLQNAYENLECLEKTENEEIQKRLSLIEEQDKELQRLHGLLVVDQRGIVARKMAL